MYIVVGLGNTGDAYVGTRHNLGRIFVDFLLERGNVHAKFLHLDTFMNKTGQALVKHVKSPKMAKKLVVIYDDLDLPLGTFKISYDRGSGGHKGVESIIKSLKTREFIRVRVGISPTTPSGKLKKPKGDDLVEKFILGEFKKSELDILKKVFKEAELALVSIVSNGVESAMNEFN